MSSKATRTAGTPTTSWSTITIQILALAGVGVAWGLLRRIPRPRSTCKDVDGASPKPLDSCTTCGSTSRVWLLDVRPCPSSKEARASVDRLCAPCVRLLELDYLVHLRDRGYYWDRGDLERADDFDVVRVTVVKNAHDDHIVHFCRDFELGKKGRVLMYLLHDGPVDATPLGEFLDTWSPLEAIEWKDGPEARER